MGDTTTFRIEDLKNYVVRFFKQLGVPEIDSVIAADVLISADLRGVSSHGVIRLHTYYGDRLRKQLIDPVAPLKVIRESAATLALDGGNGLGQAVAYRAMTYCISKAEEAGIAITTVRNSNHFGIAGYYAMMALPHDMIGISLTNARALVAPTFGRTAALGTNPIAVAVPAGSERPYVLDMATSIAPIGKVAVHQKAGKPIPEGWGIDKDGCITTDPMDVINGGALLPLGGSEEMRGYKGYGLALLVDLLSGVLSGAAFGKAVGESTKDNHADVGHFFAAIKIENFRPIDLFKADMDTFIRELKSTPKLPGQKRVFIHGEKEYELENKYRREGVPLMNEIVDALTKAGREIDIPFDIPSI